MYKVMLLVAGFTNMASAQTATLTGQIKNTVVDSVFVTHWDAVLNEEVYEGSPLDASGNFKLLFVPKKHTDYRFKCDNEVTKIKLAPGDSVHLTLDFELFDETLTYSGPAAPFNNYLAAHYLQFMNSEDYKKNLQMAYQFQIQMLDPWPYMAWIDSTTEAQLAFLAGWKAHLSAEAYTVEQGRLTFEGYNQKNLYRPLRGFFAKQSENIKEPAYPENLEDFLLAAPLNRDELVGIDNYLMICHWKLLQMMPKVYPTASSSTAAFGLSYLQLADSLCSPTIAHYVGKYWLQGGIERSGPELYELAVEKYLKSEAPEDLKNELQQIYLRALGFKIGAPAYNFELLDMQGQKVQLHDFRGKFVYVDFWASWCAPCIAELDYVQKTNFKAPDSNFVFVYISLDEEAVTWRKSVAKRLPSALHLWSKGLNSEVAKAYGIKGLPSYFLIGPDGSFLSTDPPRPSSGRLTDYLLNERSMLESQ
jgi:thiol-disulfide isomerase/thioredoxin